MKEALKALLQTPRKWNIELQAILFMAIGLALIFLYRSHYRRTLENKEQARQVVEEYLRLSEAINAVEDETAKLNLSLAKLRTAADSVLLPDIENHILHLQEKTGQLSSMLPADDTNRDSLELFVQHHLEQAGLQIAQWQGARPARNTDTGRADEFNRIRSDLLDKKAADIHQLHLKGQAHDRRDQWFNFFISLIFSVVIILAVFAVFRGVKRDRKAEESLNHALEAAESAARTKEQFLANMSHEIRTPLNAILGYSSMLASTPLKPGQQEFAQGIETAGNALLAIVNDILDLSKLEAGMVRFEAIPFQLGPLLHSIGQMFRHQAARKGLWLKIHPLQDVPDVVVGDPTRLTQMLGNLISNGIKFTSRGGIDLWVKNIREEEQVAWLSFKVQDSGIGIPREKLETIFERFEQAATDTTRKYGGAGLGLSIVSKLAELQGGHIYVRSRENQGSTFYLELPYRTLAEGEGPVPSRITEMQNASSPPLPEGLKILVAEDNPMNQHIAGLMLGRMGVEFTIAGNGLEAINLLKEKSFGLVLMDLQMPVMDGYSASREIRKLGFNIPIIAMTAHAMPGEREKCLSAGMNDYLSKPIREQDLLRAIQQQAPRQPAPPPEALQEEPVLEIDYDYLMEVAGGSKAALAELAGIFLSQAPLELEKLHASFHKQDLSNLATTAHSMKSTAAYMGMEAPLGQLLSQLELAARGDAPDGENLPLLLEKISRITEKALRKIREEVLPLCEE
ncbi:MAG: response regulator [Lewinellaceae bacterium]|nr:response regulator [Lewinellaceae bacterium]MCB9291245.1 response regulator [Lewinellaceae bacterium]